MYGRTAHIPQHIYRVALLLLLLHPGYDGLCRAQAQPTGGMLEASLVVSVTDPNGAALNAAQVRVKPKTAKGEWTAKTNQQGDASFAKLQSGNYLIQVEASGFEPQEMGQIVLKAGSNRVEVRLEVAAINEEVNISQNPQEAATDSHGIAFTSIMTETQLAQLPDDPEEFNAVLREMAGPGAVIRVNGFSGGRLPPKSQIREIRFRLNPYAAENHHAGAVSVDIYTKPGLDSWHGSLNFGFRDESLNARPAFSSARGPEQYRRFGLALDGPLWRNRTSLFLSAEGNLTFDSQSVFAALPEGIFNGFVTAPARTLNTSARIEHALTKFHTLRGEYQRNALLQNNLGVGDFNLPERAFSRNNVEHLLRLSDTGPLGRRAVNELRFQARWQETLMQPATSAPAVLVLNAFNRGGAQVESIRRVREVEFTDNFDIAFGKHSLKAGVEAEVGSYSSDELSNAGGTFTFASLDAFRALRPTTFTQRVGDPAVSFTQANFSWYVQDDFRFTKNLSFNFGLRHEMQTNLRDQKNFAPRLGFAWSPFADGKTTFRGGAGIFYQWFEDPVYEQTLRVDGLRQRDIVVRNPGFPDPFSSGTQLTLAPSRIQRDPDLRMPYITQASLNVERQLTKATMLRAGYFYQRGVHLLRGRNINAPVPGAGRPDPAAGNITQVESTANSSLHLLNLNLSPNHQKAGGRLFWLVNYSWSHAINEADGAFSLPADNFNLRAERGPSPGVARHRLFAIMNLRLIREFRLGATFRASSGLPYNITTGFDDNSDTVSNDRPAGVGRNSARGASQWDLSARLSWSFGFGAPTESASRPGATVIRTGGDGDASGALSSRGSNKRWRVQPYLQVFNIFNRFNPTVYSGVETSPFFGQPVAALPGRRIESGVRFSF